MSEVGFTKGPWRSARHYADDGGVYTAIESSGFEDVIGESGITSDANAHLIAAAPDLYKALAAIMNHHASKVLFGNRQMADNAWNALAKARGEAQ